MKRDSIGNRMKRFEVVTRHYLAIKSPIIIRVDGKNFSNLTKAFDKPYDKEFKEIMVSTAYDTAKQLEGFKFAYFQSDEITFVLTDYDTHKTQAWFDYNLQKLCSVSASITTANFNKYFVNGMHDKKITKSIGHFDSRVFNLPEHEVSNLLIWRQQDAVRNSILGLGQSKFSHSVMQNKSASDIQDMLMLDHKINWNDTETYFKRGGCIYKDSDNDLIIDTEPPIFTQDREYINKHILFKDSE